MINNSIEIVSLFITHVFIIVNRGPVCVTHSNFVYIYVFDCVIVEGFISFCLDSLDKHKSICSTFVGVQSKVEQIMHVVVLCAILCFIFAKCSVI